MGKVKIHFTGKEMDYVAKEENRMTEVAKRIEKLRALMAEQNIDAYVVPTADFHQSEYVGEHFKARRDKRRANWKMSAPNLVKCSKCGELMMPHRVCKACGSYNKKEIIAQD